MLVQGLLCALFLLAPVGQEKDEILEGMRLLNGYVHQPLQGIDSIVGQISKENGGITITYEKGRLPGPGDFPIGGDFQNRPAELLKTGRAEWHLEQTINGQPVHAALSKEGALLVSYPNKGMNFRVKIEKPEHVAEALLMVLTYGASYDKD